MQTKNLNILKETFFIDAHFTSVWDLLVDPEKTRQYLFGYSVRCDWKVGSPISWNATVNGALRTFQTGTLLSFKPYVLMSYTVIDPNETGADVANNYLTITFLLESRLYGTKLYVWIQDDAPKHVGNSRHLKNRQGLVDLIKNMKEVV